METFTDQDLIAELQEFCPPMKERTEGGITRQEWAKAQGLDPRSAGNQLNKMVDKGLLWRERQRCEDGIVRLVYYKS